MSNKERFMEALSHDHDCPCELCKDFWAQVDPDGEYIRDERDTPKEPQ
jgi:hypothetical protein